jgi:hypothetical protein
MLLPAILLAPSVSTSYVANGNVYVSDGNGFIYNVLSADIPALALQGHTLVAPRNNVSATRDPLTTDDYRALYFPGSLWVNIAPTNPHVWVCTAMGSTPGTATWQQVLSATAGTGDASSATVIPTGSTTARTLANLLADQYNNVKTFGAAGDGVTNDTTAIQNAWTAALSNGSPVYFPTGTYKVTGLDFDVTAAHTQIPLIIGAGSNRAIIDAGTSSAPTLYYHATAGNDGFFGGILNLGFKGNWAGPVIKFCADDFSSAINACVFQNVNVKNLSASASGIAVKVNYLLNSVFNNLIANTGGIGTGIALQLNQSAFNVFAGCSFSSSQTGVHITNGFNFSNRFDAPDVEVVNHCFLQDSANGNGYNKIIGGQFVWPAASQYAIVSSTSPRLVFDNVNFAPSNGSGDLFVGKVLDPSNQVGVQILGNYGDGTTPAGGAPASGSTYTNTTGQAQTVTVYPGAATSSLSVQINPAAAGPIITANTISSIVAAAITVVIRPTYSLKVTFGGTQVAWLWFPVAS